MLKKVAYAMFVSGMLLASVSAAAGSSDWLYSPFPDQSKSNDYGIRIAMTDESVFPDQSKSNDYGIRVAA